MVAEAFVQIFESSIIKNLLHYPIGPASSLTRGEEHEASLGLYQGFAFGRRAGSRRRILE